MDSSLRFRASLMMASRRRKARFLARLLEGPAANSLSFSFPTEHGVCQT